MKTNLSIVGIGASAGGLEAINELFGHLPNNTGLSFVLIQHLSPNFKSLMNSLLGRYTQMPILVVNRETIVEPNKIYLIDSANNMIIDGMVIKPIKRTDPPYPNLPIDQFFHSLSNQTYTLTVGVILSGTGTDGSRGIRSLKNANGLVFVQSPESAQFDGMPQAAIATGLVDQILSPEEIAKSLVMLSADHNIINKQAEEENGQIEQPIKAIIEAIATKTGFDYSPYRKASIFRRIQRRQLLTHHKTLEAYARYVETDDTEAETLRKEILIGVTSFFRDEEAFVFLQQEVIPELFANKTAGETIRIWLPACSTGEEAYSIAILLEEHLRQHPQDIAYKIFGTDVNPDAILTAKAGIYSLSANSILTNEMIEQYFRRISNEDYRLETRVRENIVFAVHNALTDPPFIQMDMISCRNFLIYLNPETQYRLLSNFHFGLNHLGYLFLGSSEAPGKLRSSLRVISEKHKVYQVIEPGKATELHQIKADPSRFMATAQTDFPPPKLDMPTPGGAKGRGRKNFTLAKNTYRQLLLDKYVPSCLIVDEELNLHFANGDLTDLLHFPNSTDDFTLAGMLDFSMLVLIKSGIQQVQETNQPIEFEQATITKGSKKMTGSLRFEALPTNGLFLIEIKILRQTIEKEEDVVRISDKTSLQKHHLQAMDMEIQSLKQDNEELVDQLENANQELQSSTEELQAANEELQSSNEALQSLNEELYTVNAELQEKVRELLVANSDMDNLLRTTEIATIFIDKELKIRKFTASLARYFHLLETDIGRRITTFVHHIPGIDFFGDIKTVIESNVRIEREVVDRNDKVYLLRIFPYLIKDRVEGAVASFIDVTLLKNTVRQMESLAAKFKAIFENTDYNITILSPEGDILDINYIFEGDDKNEAIGVNLLTLGLPDEELIRENLALVVEKKEPVSFSSRFYLSTGEEKWLTSNYIPLLEDGKVTKIISISKDDTYFKGVEGQLHLNAAIFDKIFRYDQQHVMILNPAGDILEINYTDAGYDKEDLIGKNFIAITTEEQRHISQQAYDRVMAGEDYVIYQTRIITPDKIWYYHNMLMPVHLDGTLQALVMLVREITDLSAVDMSQWEDQAATS